MKRSLSLLAIPAVSAILGIYILMQTSNAAEEGESSASQTRTFTTRSIQGAWGWSAGYGVVVPPAVPEPLPTVGMGTVVFDGQGGCIVTSTLNQNGTVIGPVTSDSCTYTVNADGTGSSVTQFSDPQFPPSSSVAFVIVDHGREIRFITTDFVVGGFIAKRQ